MLARALRSGQQLFKRAPKVVIPEDPATKPMFILKLMGFYNKDSVLPRQAKKLYTAAKDQARTPCASTQSSSHLGVVIIWFIVRLQLVRQHAASPREGLSHYCPGLK